MAAASHGAARREAASTVGSKAAPVLINPGDLVGALVIRVRRGRRLVALGISYGTWMRTAFLDVDVAATAPPGADLEEELRTSQGRGNTGAVLQ